MVLPVKLSGIIYPGPICLLGVSQQAPALTPVPSLQGKQESLEPEKRWELSCGLSDTKDEVGR